MELGIGMFGDVAYDRNTKQFQPAGERFLQMIEQVKLADELGLDVFAVGEHHRRDFAVSSPEIILAALSTITKKIKLASGVTVLSSSDPVKVYQDFATVDLLSNGRAEIIAGRGSFTESFPMFGFDLRDYDDLFVEKLDLLLQINEKETLSWKGKFRPEIKNQTVLPRALNNGKLPIWITVGGTPESVDRAARLGLPIIFAIIGGMAKQFKPLIEYYKQAYIASGHDVNKMQIGVHSHTFVTETNEKILTDVFPLYQTVMNRVGVSRGWPPYSEAQFKNGLSKDGALYMGEPNQVIDKILATIEMFGLTRYVAHIDIGGQSHENLMKCIELYGTRVVPELRKALEK